MGTYRRLEVERRGQIAFITLSRAEVGNVIDLKLADELAEACRQINEDEEIRVVILTGSGRVFSLGNEIKEKDNLPPSAAASKAVANLNVPVIAAINGDAFGGGLELALACDLRLACEEAHFAFPEVSQGLIPGGGGTQRLPRIVGKGKALEMILTAEPIDAREAYRVGLVNKITPFEKLLSEAEALAQKIASKGPIAERYAKEAINKGLDMTLEQGLRLEADLSIILQTTEDREAGIKAFLEKRKTQFKGK